MNSSEFTKSIRDAYSKRKEDTFLYDQEYQNIVDVIKSIIIKKYGNNDLTNDLVQQSLVNLINSFDHAAVKEDSFWENNIGLNIEKDKKIIAYVYKIVHTSHREITHTKLNNETYTLERAIKSIVSEYAAKGNLKANKDGTLQHKGEQKPLFNGDITLPFFSLRDKNGRLHWEVLADLISLIFSEYLENYALSISNLIEIILDNTDIGSIKFISIDEPIDTEEDTEIATIELNNVDHKFNADLETQSQDIVMTWLKRLDDCFTEDEIKFNASLFILKFVKFYTYREIKEKLQTNLPISSIDYRLKKLLNCMAVSKEIDVNDPNLDYHLQNLSEQLNKKYMLVDDLGVENG